MTMNWISLGADIAKLGAPMIASVFLGPEAGPLVGALVGKLADALGCANTPEAVQSAIATDPAAADKVKAVEASQSDLIQAYLADVADARSTNVQLVQAGSSIAYGPVVVSCIITLGFFGLLVLMLFSHLDDSSLRVSAIINVIIGTLGAAFTQVCNYWLGSTSNSKARMDQLATIAQSVVAPAARIGKATVRR